MAAEKCTRSHNWQYKGLKLDEVALKLQQKTNQLNVLQCFNESPVCNDLSLLEFPYDSTVTSLCHSKSLSCDTLESLDSGLDSSCSNLTGSQGSLDALPQPQLCQSENVGGLESPSPASPVRELREPSQAPVSPPLPLRAPESPSPVSPDGELRGPSEAPVSPQLPLRAPHITPPPVFTPVLSSPVDYPLRPLVIAQHTLGSPVWPVGSTLLDMEDDRSPMLVWYRQGTSSLQEVSLTTQLSI